MDNCCFTHITVKLRNTYIKFVFTGKPTTKAVTMALKKSLHSSGILTTLTMSLMLCCSRTVFRTLRTWSERSEQYSVPSVRTVVPGTRYKVPGTQHLPGARWYLVPSTRHHVQTVQADWPRFYISRNSCRKSVRVLLA